MITDIKRERRLIIAVKYGGGTDGAEKFADKASQPDAFLRGMCGCDILRLSRGQCDELLFVGTPRNRASVDEICKARDGSPMVLQRPVCVCIPGQFVPVSPYVSA